MYLTEDPFDGVLSPRPLTAGSQRMGRLTFEQTEPEIERLNDPRVMSNEVKVLIVLVVAVTGLDLLGSVSGFLRK